MAKKQEMASKVKKDDLDYIGDLHAKLDEVLDALNALHEGQCAIEERLETIETALMVEGLGLDDESEVDD